MLRVAARFARRVGFAIQGRFDALVSLGMLEHVGAKHYRDFGRMIDRCLGPSGRGLIQVIGRNHPIDDNHWIRRRIFPGGHIPTIRELTGILAPWKFSILDVENLRLHYAATLRHWPERFEAAAEKVAAMFDDRFVRTWRLYLTGYLTGSAAAFRTGALQLFQVVFARPGLNDIPWTRSPLYASELAFLTRKCPMRGRGPKTTSGDRLITCLET